MSRWQEKANALWDGWVQATGAAPPNPNALMLVLAQAEHETNSGDAWDHSHNFGACNLRAMNEAEREAYATGDLKVGMWLYADGSWGDVHRTASVGTLRGDSSPNTGAFRVWFAAFPTDALGAAYMLKAGVRAARAVLLDPTCSPDTYAWALYQGCYYEGIHAGARRCGQRSIRLDDNTAQGRAENANVRDYAGAMAKILPAINLGLAAWTSPGDYSGDQGGGHSGERGEPTQAGDNVGALDPEIPDLPTGTSVRGEPPHSGDE